jgi:endonuclease/exonuclease/phosphatase family metal-dependent hydrolase
MQVRLRDLIMGRELCIATTHLKSKEGVTEEQTRTQQIRQLLHHLKPELLGEPLSVNTAAPAMVLVGSLEPDAATVPSSSNGNHNGNGRNGTQAEATCSSCDCDLADEQAAAAGSGSGQAQARLMSGEPSSSSSATAGGTQALGNGSALRTLPVIIAGDFNATPESVPCRVRVVCGGRLAREGGRAEALAHPDSAYECLFPTNVSLSSGPDRR